VGGALGVAFDPALFLVLKYDDRRRRASEHPF
jgi:hypothetical protein